jgi:hypothetical protein
MTNERRGDRRPPQRGGGGGQGDFRPQRGGGGGQGDFRPQRGGRPHFNAAREGPPADRGYPPRDGRLTGGRPPFPERPAYGDPRGGVPDQRQRPAMDDGGMNVRVDPRRLRLLKELAGEAGVRPGELVLRWVEERLDAERAGAPAPGAAPDRLDATLSSISSRLDALASRVSALEGRPQAAGGRVSSTAATPIEAPVEVKRPGSEPASSATRTRSSSTAASPAERGRVRPRRSSRPATSKALRGERIALHEEIIEVIRARGPQRAGELAAAITERGRYHAPRSARPLDAATVNSRVSNPVYRARFVREGGKIGLAGD